MNKTEHEECEVIGKMPTKNESQALNDITQKKIVGIYGLRNKVNNKWYIGQSWNIYDRWKEAYQYLGCKGQPKIYNALKKYGYDGFEKRIIEICGENIPQEMLDLKETAWISHFNSFSTGYNLKTGGAKGKHSPESRMKMSISHKGVPLSKKHRDNMVAAKQITSVETRRKMSLSHLGKKRAPFSEEHKKKLSEWQIGRVFTKEHRQKLSRATAGRKWTLEQKQKHKIRMKEAYRMKSEKEKYLL